MNLTYGFRTTTLGALRHGLHFAIFIFMTVCGLIDPYVAILPQIALEVSLVREIQQMGQPDSTIAIEVPFLKVVQHSWRARGKGRLYLILLVQDRGVIVGMRFNLPKCAR